MDRGKIGGYDGKHLNRNTSRLTIFGPWLRTIVAVVAGGLLFSANPVLAADPSAGSRIYIKHCQDCHGADGKPVFPGAPDFSRGEKLLQPDADLLNAIKNGTGIMPAYQGLYTDEELLDVVAYLRTLH